MPDLKRLQQLAAAGDPDAKSTLLTIQMRRGELRMIEVGSLNYSVRARSMDIRDHTFEDLSVLVHFKQLEHLNIQNTLAHDLSPLCALQNLSNLDCTQVHDLSPLMDLQSLKELETEGTPVSDETLAALKTHRTQNT